MYVHHLSVEAGDWEALYIDGSLFAEGHSTSHWDWGRAINWIGSYKERHFFFHQEIPDEIIENGAGSFPEDISELPNKYVEWPDENYIARR